MRKSSFWALTLLLLVIFSISLLGEKIPMNDGAGFDGEFYRKVAESFCQDFFNSGYDNFRIQRIFPFFLVNIVFETIGIETTHQNLMHAMLVLQFANLGLLLFLFRRMADFLKWKNSTGILLFSIFFFNHYILKNCGYEPFQTDFFALSVALGSYLLHLKGFHKASIFVGALGIITWPLVAEQMFILNLFHKKASPAEPIAIKKYLPATAASLYILSILAVTGVFILTGYKHWLGILLMTNANMVPSPLITGISLVLFAAVIYLVAKSIPPEIWVHPREYLKSAYISRFLLILGIALVPRIVLKLLSNDELFSNPAIFSLQILFRPIKYPLISLAGHVAYYGILPCIIILKFKDFCRAFARQSTGHLLLLCIILVFSFDSESRHMTSFLPIMLLPLGEVLDKMDLSTKSVAVLVSLQLFLSHFFFPINTPNLLEKFQNWDFYNWTAQRYFMNFGAFMDHESYLIWLILAVLALICTRLAIKKL